MTASFVLNSGRGTSYKKSVFNRIFMNNPIRGKSASGMRFIKRYPKSKPMEKTLFEETDEFTEYVSELPAKIFN